MTLTAAALCSGVGGLELGIERALDARTVWQSEIDPHGDVVLSHHWPDVPNLGDLTAVDWAQVEPVDLMCFGFPCQDISSAGRRAGIEGDASALWFDCAAALRVLRPRYLLVENVSDLLVRGFDVVLADLAAMGYVGRWGCLRSSDAGAPHRRQRIFLAATHTGSTRAGRDDRAIPRAATPARRPGADVRPAVHGGAAPTDPSGAAGRTVGHAKPRDRRAAHARGGTPEPGGRDRPASHADGPGREGHGSSFTTGRSQLALGPAPDPDGERLTLWPEHHGEAEDAAEGHHTLDGLDADGRMRWGVYESAIRRWEAIHGPAPSPRDDRGRLNPELPEWMMGFPPGWVTGLDIPRTAQLRLVGNAVQPQVAELAARLLLAPLIAAMETAA